MQKTANCGLIFHALPSSQIGLISNCSRSPLVTFKLRNQMLRIMRMLTFFMLVAILSANAEGTAQTVTIRGTNLTLKDVFSAVKKQTGYVVFHNKRDLNENKTISLTVSKIPLKQFLDLLAKELSLEYTIEDKTIVYAKRTRNINIRLMDSLSGNQEMRILISGRVQDADGNSIAGVSITVKGTSTGTTTDANGHFSINVLPGQILVISSVNFKEREIKVGSETSMTITLVRVVSSLDDIVIKGYYNTTKRKSTSAVGTVTAEEIAKQPVANPLNALQGRVAGALITQSNGLPGSRVTVQIRGQNSIENGTIPLYIIDGIPFNITTQAVPVRDDLNSFGISGANGAVSPFSVINPADIERIDILKDVDATAIYGSRGSNGVVLITTKKARAGKTRIDLNVYSGIGKVARQIEMMNTQQYLALRKEAFANDGLTATAANAPDLMVWDQNAYTNWQDKYMGGTAGTTDAQLTVSGGDSRTRFLLNGGYHKETTVMPGSLGSDRISGRFNGDHSSANKKLNINLSISYAADKTNLNVTDPSSVYNLPPNMPLYNPNGTLYWYSGINNPEALFMQKYIGKTSSFITNTGIRYSLLPGLDFKTNFGFTRISIKQNTQLPGYSKNPVNMVSNSARFADITQESWLIEPQLNYNKRLGEVFVSVLAGTSFQRNLNEGLSISADNYTNPAQLGSLTGAGTNPAPDMQPSYTLYKYTSVFGRLNFEWKSRYILNATVRRDGSSRFGPGKRFGTFGSVAAAWIFSDEDGLREALPFLSFGKIRSSYGITGNDQFSDYYYMSTLASASGSYAYQGSSVLFPARIPNPALAWESTKRLDVGIELGFAGNRIYLNAGYYHNRSSTQVSTVRVSSVAGTNAYTGNLPATIQNTGLEFELNTTNIKTKDFSWKTSLNLTIPRSKFVAIDKSYFNASTAVLNEPITAVLRYVYMGTDPATGRPLYAAFNASSTGKDTVTFTPSFNLDRRVIGNSAPTLYGGINNELSFKNFELSFFFQYTRREGQVAFTTVPGVLANIDASRTERWTAPGQNAVNPRATTVSTIYSNYAGSDATWGDASWLRLRNVSLSYTFSQNWIQKAKLQNLRVFVTGQNLFVTSKVKSAFDPETGISMPPLRVLTAGISCSF